MLARSTKGPERCVRGSGELTSDGSLDIGASLAEHKPKYELTGSPRDFGGSSQAGKPVIQRTSLLRGCARAVRVCPRYGWTADAQLVAECELRAAARHHLAKSYCTTCQRESGGDRFLRSKNSGSSNLSGASIGSETAPPSPSDSTISSSSVLSVEYLPSRQIPMSVLCRTVSCFRAYVRSRRPGVAGRPQSMGEHCHVLHRVQSDERREDAARSRTDARAATQAADLSPRPRHHVRHGRRSQRLARLPLLGGLTHLHLHLLTANGCPKFHATGM